MKDQHKISVVEWHTLAEEKKERVRKWAVLRGYGLDIIPNETAEACDYAALLTLDQMKLLLSDLRKKSHGKKRPMPVDYKHLWKEIEELL